MVRKKLKAIIFSGWWPLVRSLGLHHPLVVGVTATPV